MTEKFQTKFGLTKQKSTDFSDWYLQTVTLSDLIEPYNVRGFIIMKEPSMFIWNTIKDFINKDIKTIHVKEHYFPMLISKEHLEKEKSHIDNFQPEVAWITKSGDCDIEPMAVRPTSETIMYPYFSKCIRSYRDLPLKVNQWCNILRWEVKSTVPFIRGREFLWQEGHCAYISKEECDKEVRYILDLYKRVYKDLLAVPVIEGKKSENEKFGGADYTLTVEAFIQGSRRAVQAATSHSLGTNFARMFDIKYSGPSENEEENYAWQSSWGLTTRSIGVAVMTHSDDIGLVLPPRIAHMQVIIVPCGKVSLEVKEYINTLYNKLISSDIRVSIDERENVSPGYKFNYWEIRGVPLRIEIGAKDVKNNSMIIVRRDKMKKEAVENGENISSIILDMLDKMHEELYNKAHKELHSSIKRIEDYSEFISALNNNGMVLMSWCNTAICEELIKEKSAVMNEKNEIISMGAKSLCIPFEFQENINAKCAHCEKEATCNALFGRSY